MKTIISAFVVAALISTPVWAASKGAKALPTLPQDPGWTGCYVDAGYGYGLFNQTQHTETFPGLAPTTSGDSEDGGRGWLGRIGGGCDYQLTGGLSHWVVGAFGDYDVMGLKGTDSLQNVGTGGGVGPPTTAPEKENDAWYIGGRIGYLVTPALLSNFDGGYTETTFGQ